MGSGVSVLRAAVDWGGCHGPWRPRPGAGRLPAGRVMYCRVAGRPGAGPGGWKAGRLEGSPAKWRGGRHMARERLPTHPPAEHWLFTPFGHLVPFPRD